MNRHAVFVEKPWSYVFSGAFFYAEQQSSGLPFWLMGIGYWLSGQRGRNGPLSATHSRIPITAAHNREVLPRRGSSYE
jgi:hypothetical protein